MALGAQVVDLVRPDGLDQADQAGAVGEVAVVEDQRLRVGVSRVGVRQVIEPFPPQARGAADHSVHLVALGQEQLGQVRPVLAGDAGDQRLLGHEPASLD